MKNGISKTTKFPSIDALNDIKNSVGENENCVNAQSKMTKSYSVVTDKNSAGFIKHSFKILTIPKRTTSTSQKDKNEPSRFLGEGVTFKAKLIGILEVEEARGDRMCQEALFELKMAVRAAGEHKQRINIVIATDGIRLRDEKTADCLHHHPVHKISFIAQDVADSRAFGYIFGSPDTSHRFFGIKTDKAASQVVMAMRDLFQTVYELKKREVEMAKQNIEQHQLKYGSSFFLDSMPASSLKNNSVDQVICKQTAKEETVIKSVKNKTQTASVIANLMDLEVELNSLQQGLSQMERFTPSDPFGPSPSLAKEDPFGDSFTPPPCITTSPPAKLPPPPSTGDRRKIGSSSSAVSQPEAHWFAEETRDLFSSEKNSTANEANKKEEGSSCSERKTATSKDLYDIFTELDPLGTGRSKPYTDKKDFFQELKNPPKKQLKDFRNDNSSTVNDSSLPNYSPIVSASSIFPENIDKLYDDHLGKYHVAKLTDRRITLVQELAKSCDINYDPDSDPFETSFANFASFEEGCCSSSIPRRSPLSYTRQKSPSVQVDGVSPQALKSTLNGSYSVYRSVDNGDDVDSSSINEPFSQRNRSQWKHLHEGDMSKHKIVINLHKVLSNVDDTDNKNDSPVAEEALPKNRNRISTCYNRGVIVSSDSFESIPEPPPRPITSLVSSHPPPLPPKKLHIPVTLKPPSRPSSDTLFSNYDYIENYESHWSRRQKNGAVQLPPLPAPARKPKFNQVSDRDNGRQRLHKQNQANASSSEVEYYLTPISNDRGGYTKLSLKMIIGQLTSIGFDDLAATLKIPASKLSCMTLKELTECLSKLSNAECQKLDENMNNKNGAGKESKLRYLSLNESFGENSEFQANFEEKFPSRSVKCSSAPPHDKYSVFRELINQEEKIISSRCEDEFEEGTKQADSGTETKSPDERDKYEALRSITVLEDEECEKRRAEDEKIHSSDYVDEVEDEKHSEVHVDNQTVTDEVKADVTSTDPTNQEAVTVEMNEADIKTRKEHKDVIQSEVTIPVRKSWYKFEDHETNLLPSQNNSVCSIKYEKRRSMNHCDDEDDEEELEEDDDDNDDDEDNGENELEGDANDEDSEENRSLKMSAASSWDESSWRENGWSDRDSLYDEDTKTYSDHYQFKRENYHCEYLPKRSDEQSPWEETSWSALAHEARFVHRYNRNELRTLPRSTSERKNFSSKGTDELTLLKMILGKKRLKALQEQILKQYHEQLENAPAKKYSHIDSSKRNKDSLVTSPKSIDRQYGEVKGCRNYGRKYYTVQRATSTAKRRESLLPHPHTEESMLSKKYSEPYNHEEFNVSEKERWTKTSRKSPNCKKSSRSRNHNQTSPFENNFTPAQQHEFSGDDEYSVPLPLNTSPTLLARGTPLKGRNQARFSPKSGASESKKQRELHPGYASYIRCSRESNQWQSPFEDDFLASVVGVRQKDAKEGPSTDKEVPYGVTKSTRSRYTDKRTIYEWPNNNHYENVELWKKTPPFSGEKNLTIASKEWWDRSGNMEAAAATSSPKKGKSRQHDPFNDGFQEYDSREVSRSRQNSKNKSKPQNCDSGSDSNHENATAASVIKWNKDATSFTSCNNQQQQPQHNSYK